MYIIFLHVFERMIIPESLFTDFFPVSRSEPPGVIINDISNNKISFIIKSEFDFEVNQAVSQCIPSSFQKQEYLAGDFFNLFQSRFIINDSDAIYCRQRSDFPGRFFWMSQSPLWNVFRIFNPGVVNDFDSFFK